MTDATSFDSISGRIIKLTINCKRGKRTKSFVLLFKYEGSFNCKFKLIFCISRTLLDFFYPLLLSKSIIFNSATYTMNFNVLRERVPEFSECAKAMQKLRTMWVITECRCFYSRQSCPFLVT